MRWQWAVAVVALCLIATCGAVPRVFLGGSFSGLDGLPSKGFAGWNVEESKWEESVSDPHEDVRDLDYVRGGLFVAGTFTNIDGKPSGYIGFWDGSKWCAIRQGLTGGNGATAVWCDSDTSCWVAGDFTQVINLQDQNSVTNFAHYTFDESANEWVFDVSQRGWSELSGNTIGSAVDDASLVVVGSGSSPFFFLSTGGNNGGVFNGGRTIWRGSRQDNGFWVYADGATTVEGLNILDFSIDLSVGTPVLYLITDNFTDGAKSSLKSTIPLTIACAAEPCEQPISVATNYTQMAATNGVNNTVVVQYRRVFAAPNDVRYLVALYDPDGTGGEYGARERVMSQTGSNAPVLIGSAFQTDSYTFLNSATWFGLMPDGRLLVQGSFLGANLYYPPSPVTTDASGVTIDRRSLDLVTSFAVWNGSLWQEPFGGGMDGESPSTTLENLRWVFDNDTNHFWFIGQDLAHAYNTRADKAAFFDDDSSLSVPLFPLFDRNVLNRNSEGEVLAIVCDTSACSDVFVAGSFAFHGEQVIGSIAKVAVSRTGPAQPEEVGGGLWSLTTGFYNEDKDFQRRGGYVDELLREGDYLYAGGYFERAGTADAVVCLNNLARINVVTAGSVWEDLAGGCDGGVHDLAIYNGLLYAGGAFEQCGTAYSTFVAAYSYQDAAPVWSDLRGGVDDTVYSLEVFQGRLIAGGDFTLAGGIPVSGVASWDGSKWRALLPACTDDCVGTREFYFNALSAPVNVYVLRTSPDGDSLWALARYQPPVKRGGPIPYYLSQWQYTDGDFGRWLAKGDQLKFVPDDSSEVYGQTVAFLDSDVVIVAGVPNTDQFDDTNGNISPFNTNLENWYAGFRTQSNVFVLSDTVGSASALSSPLSALLSLF